MLKKLLFAISFCLVSGGAFAACTNPLPITSGGGSPGTVNMSVSQNTADAGCMYNVTPNQGGAPLSNTNGWWTNILQGNVALSAANPLFSSVTDGTNKAAVKAASTAPGATDPALVVGLSPNGNQATAANQPTNAAQGSNTSSQTGSLVQCAATTAAPSYTTAQTDPFSCDLSGNLRVTASGLAIGSTTSGQQGSMVMAAATTYSPTTTTADTWPLSQDTVGNLRVFQSAPSTYASGTSNTTGTSSTQLIAAVTSERIYASAYDCSNSGSTTTVVSFQDGSGGSALATTILPAGGGHISPGNWLIRTTAGNGLFYASGSASTTVYCTATGYAGN